MFSADPAYVSTLRRVLTGAGYEVMVPAEGVEPHRFVAEVDPDAVVIDVPRRGEVRAWRTLADLVLDPATAAIPVVVCTVAAVTPGARQDSTPRRQVRALLGPVADDALPALLRVAVGSAVPAAVDPTIWSPLSAREWEVAILVAAGLTNRAIAKALTVTEGTTANHVRRILRRLGLESRTQIALWVVRNPSRREDAGLQ